MEKTIIKFTAFDENGNEIDLPTYTEEESNEMTRKLIEQHDNLFNGFKAWLERIRVLGDKIQEVFEKGKELTQKEFDKKFPAVKSYMEKQGLMLPTDAEEFFKWFLLIKYREHSFDEISEKWPEIQPNDFNEFNKYKIALFENGGNFVRLPLSLESEKVVITDSNESGTVKKVRKRVSRLPQTLEQCFKSERGGFKRVLNDAIHVGLILKNDDFPNGYKWIYQREDKKGDKTNRGHGLRALWDEAKENKFIIDKHGHEKHIAKLFKDYFGFETLGHGVFNYTYTVKNENEYKKLREKLRIQLVKIQ